MSNPGGLNPEPLPRDAWQRWEMATFDSPRTAPASSVTSPVPALPADVIAQIERLREQTRAAAQAEGYAAGRKEGLSAGKQEGFLAGEKEGHEAGFSAGHTAGRESSQREAEQLAGLTEACAQAISSIEAEMGQALISLAINIAQQVLRTTVSVHPEKILDVVRDIVQINERTEAVLRLRVNPADFELVQAHLADDSGTKNWRLDEDASVERGGCLADTVLGNIDATLQTRWQRVVAALGHEKPWSIVP